MFEGCSAPATPQDELRPLPVEGTGPSGGRGPQLQGSGGRGGENRCSQHRQQEPGDQLDGKRLGNLTAPSSNNIFFNFLKILKKM